VTVATKRGIRWAILTGVMFATTAEAATSRGPATQIEHIVGHGVRPIQRAVGRLGESAWLASIGDDSGTPAVLASTEKRGTEDFQWGKVIPAGKEIEIKGVNGDISASRASGKEVEVKAYKTAKRSDPADVTIEVIEHEDGVTICSKYPDVRGKENVCGPGNEGHMNTEDCDVRVQFEVRVPAGVRLVAHTVNGEVKADGLQGPVDAATVNGSVRVGTTSYASATTVNGSIVVSMGDAQWTEPLSFETVNGEIRLTLPAKLDADVRAETMNGQIDSDYSITVSGKFNRRRLHGTIGKGGRRMDLQTVNGDIVLSQRSS
jgi:putative adhesin